MFKEVYKQNKEIAHSFFWRSLQILAKQGIIFLIFFVSANYLSPEVFGHYNYIMALVALLIVFSDFGISSATSKFVAEYKVKNPNKIGSIFYSAAAIIFLVCIILSAGTILFGKQIFGEDYIYVIYLLPYLFFVPLTSVLDGVYRGLRKFKQLALISIITGIFSFCISFILIKKFLLMGAIITQNLMFVLLTIVLFIFKNGYVKKISFDKKLLIKFVKYSAVIGITSVMFYLYTRADILVLNYFGYVVEIGYYEIINKIFNLIIIPFTILGQVIGPSITADYVSKKFKKVKAKFRQQVTITFIVAIFICLSLYLFFPMLIRSFFQKYFTDATIIMFKLLLITLPLKLIAPVVTHGHTIATGNAHYSMWTMIPAGIANVVLDFYFIAKYGFIGVVYSTLICYTFATSSFMILYYLKLKRLCILEDSSGY